MVLFGPEWCSLVIHEILDNHKSKHEIKHSSIRKLYKNKKALKSTIYHDVAKDDTRYLMLDSMLLFII